MFSGYLVSVPSRIEGSLVVAGGFSASTFGAINTHVLSTQDASFGLDQNCLIDINGSVTTSGSLTLGSGEGTNAAVNIEGDGSKSGSGYTDAGTAWSTSGTPAFAPSQKYLRINVGGTTYRIPLWAD